MKVSVIVPVYNAAEYLEECLMSIISQTYKNLEIILINDGSKDNSGEICDQYKAVDNRIIVIHQDNQGVSSARNRGIEIASGQLITFVDSDDIIDPEMVERLCNDLKDDQADIAICSYRTFRESGSEDIGNSGRKYVFSKDEAIANLISGKYYIGGLCTKLYRTDIIKGCRLDERIRINEDVLMNYYVFQNAQKVVFNDSCMYNYRANVKGATNTIDGVSGRADEYNVAQKMYEDSAGKAYNNAAEKRYFVSMLNYYQSFVMNGQGKTEKAVQLKQKLKNENAKNKLSTRPERIRCIIFTTFPAVATIVYRIHEKVRANHRNPIFD